jgi:hypothetical protein
VLTEGTGPFMRKILSDHDVRSYLGANEYDGTWWYNKESMEDLLYWFYVISAIKLLSLSREAGVVLIKQLKTRYQAISSIIKRSTEAHYCIDDLLAIIDKKPRKKLGSS